MTTTLVRLREAFDNAFAEPPPAHVATVDLLAITCGAATYHVPVSELATVLCDRPIVAVPSPLDELLGVVNVRGGIVAVYSLARLLGQQAPPQAPRWIAVCAGADRVGVAFDEVSRYLRIPLTQPIDVLSLSPLIASIAARCASLS